MYYFIKKSFEFQTAKIAGYLKLKINSNHKWTLRLNNLYDKIIIIR